MSFIAFISFVAEIAHVADFENFAGLPGGLHHAFGCFIAGLISLPIAVGFIIIAFLTILTSILIIPLQAATGGVLSVSGIFFIASLILLLLLWFSARFLVKYADRLLYSEAVIVPLDAAPDMKRECVGLKGKGIGIMMKAGLRTAPGFIINGRCFMQWVKKNKLGKEIAALTDAPEAQRRVLELLDKYPIPKKTKNILSKGFRKFRSKEIIIRSSFPDEDGENASMAGVYESVVVCATDWESALKKVWASYFSRSARSARARAKLSPRPLGLPVIVQERIAHDVFLEGSTVNVVNGRTEESLLNYDAGRSSGLLVYNALQESLRVASGPGDGFPEEEVTRPLLDAMARLDAIFKKPIQIEAGLKKGKIFFHQVRPITGFEPCETLVNSYIVDMIDVPLTPLSTSLFDLPASIERDVFRHYPELASARREKIIVEHHGRFYLRYNSIRDYLNEYRKEDAKSLLRAAPGALRFLSFFLFPDSVWKLIDKIEKELSTRDFDAISEIRDGVLLPLFNKQLFLFSTCGTLKDAMERFLQKVIPEKYESVVQPALFAPEYVTPYAKMIDDLSKLDDSGEESMKIFLAEHGHWGTPEPEAAAPRLAESLEELISNIPRKTESPDAEDVAADVLKEIRRAWKPYVFNAGKLAFNLLRSRYQVALCAREIQRSLLNKTLFEIKKLALDKRGDDAFFTRVEEIEQGASKREIDERRELHREHLNANPGAIVHLPETQSTEMQSGTITGMGIGNTKVSGSALVAKTPCEVPDSQKSVLIIRRPDGAFSSMLGSVSALVIERGSPLSHLVLLAHETGVPVLIGASGAASRVKTGDAVTLDAQRGWLSIEG